MTTESVARARAAFRETRIPERYSGPVHLATVIGFSVVVAAASLAMLDGVEPAEGAEPFLKIGQALTGGLQTHGVKPAGAEKLDPRTERLKRWFANQLD